MRCRQAGACDHQPPPRFRPGEEVPLEITDRGPATLSFVVLCYRHVNQAERFRTRPTTAGGRSHRATIPARYTDSPYPLMYYFQLVHGPESVSLYPGFSEDLLNQPYFVVPRA